VFKYQPLGNNAEPFRQLIAAYERLNSEVDVVAEAIPNASDIAHQYFLTALEGGARTFDVLVADIVWVHEFARAGWIGDLSPAFPPEMIRRDFLPGLADAVVVNGKTVAVPWYADAGLLYYRTDLVPRAPRTYDELQQFTLQAVRANPHVQGYLWQGRQYEGLVCNVYEAIWGQGGATGDERIELEAPEVRAALGYLRSLLTSGVSPSSVTSAAEEDSRRIFQRGGAVFMRNWPYAWAEAQRKDSPIRGKVGIASLPAQAGDLGHGTLGGWQLALNARAPEQNRRAALGLIEHLTSAESSIALALAYGRNPARLAVYDDRRLIEGSPIVSTLASVLKEARPRPLTTYYNLVSDTLQSEFSAAITGIHSPESAVRNAQRQLDRIAGEIR
jgi:multiple sugar transport system substrate-binding protein